MSNSQHSVNVGPTATSRASTIALVLGILSVPGSVLAWDTLPGGGFVWGLPLAIAAVAVGVQALRNGGGSGRAAAIAGVILGGAMIAMMVIWTAVGAG